MRKIKKYDEVRWNGIFDIVNKVNEKHNIVRLAGYDKWVDMNNVYLIKRHKNSEFEEAAGGIKYDKDKLGWYTMPWEQLKEAQSIIDQYGAKKYGVDNWKKVQGGHDRFLNAGMRHFIDYMQGEELDSETGKSHLAHVIVNCLFAMWHKAEGMKHELQEKKAGK